MCVDFHNVMLIYVQTIANNFSRAISSPSVHISADSSPARLNNCGDEYSTAEKKRKDNTRALFQTAADTQVFIITLVIKLTVTYIAGHLSPIFTICPSVLNSEMNSHTSPLAKKPGPHRPTPTPTPLTPAPLEQSINSPRSQSARIQLFPKP